MRRSHPYVSRNEQGVPDRWKSRCKGPVIGVRLGLQDSEEAGVAGAEGGPQEMALRHGRVNSALDKPGWDVL